MHQTVRIGPCPYRHRQAVFVGSQPYGDMTPSPRNGAIISMTGRAMNFGRVHLVRYALALVFWSASFYGSEADGKVSDNFGDTVDAYYHCLEETSMKMALASSEPAETIVKGARTKCTKVRRGLLEALDQAKSAGELTDLGVAKLINTAEEEASNRAIAAVIDARSRPAQRLSKEQQEELDNEEEHKSKILAACTVENAEKLALTSDKPAENVAQAAVALCSEEVKAFADADARSAGRPAATSKGVEEAKRLVTNQLIARITSARAAVKNRRDQAGGQ